MVNDFENNYKLLFSELENFCNNKEEINIDEIKKVFKYEFYSKGEFYIREGETPNKIGFITKGLMKYYYIDLDGNEWIKYFSGENSFTASYASFLYQFPSLYFIEAIEDTTILSINFDTYIKNINSSNLWCTIARKHTEKIYYEKEKREASLLKESGSERYANFLKEFSQLSNRISLKDTASFLGLTAVSLSRIRNMKQGKINKC
ncbi:MAG: Crp/Fnr family transcriptional regulator [Ignavibacteriae bacterium]|nr:Crp/Fnr family transcriptional regulator [Ignavibacteriota bacterium]